MKGRVFEYGQYTSILEVGTNVYIMFEGQDKRDMLCDRHLILDVNYWF